MVYIRRYIRELIKNVILVISDFLPVSLLRRMLGEVSSTISFSVLGSLCDGPARCCITCTENFSILKTASLKFNMKSLWVITGLVPKIQYAGDDKSIIRKVTPKVIDPGNNNRCFNKEFATQMIRIIHKKPVKILD